MARSKIAKSPKTTNTPGWIDDILKAIDDVTTPIGSPGVSGRYQKLQSTPVGHKVTATANFALAALGFAFSVVNAVYLSTIDKQCSGYNSEEQKFLFAVSIVFSAFFGLLTISSIYGLGIAFK